jgi:hypothetical protein
LAWRKTSCGVYLDTKAQQLRTALGSPHALVRAFITAYEEEQGDGNAREAELL